MQANKLKSNIYIVVFLAVLVVFQHISHVLEYNSIWFILPFSITVLVFTIIYFIQLTNNLKNYLAIENIKFQTYTIIGSYVFIYLITNLILSDKGTLSHSNFKYKDVIIGIVVMIFVATSIFLIVQYCVLGYKLIKKNTTSNVKKLGFSFFIIIPIGMLLMTILATSKNYKIYGHFLTIAEISPYWLTYKLYKEILSNKEITPLETN